MKKLNLILGLFLISFNAFSRDGIDNISDSGWVIIILVGIVLIISFTYFFIHAFFERYIRDNEIQKLQQEEIAENAIEEDIKQSDHPKSDDLMNLFMLKRKGIITEREYTQFKDRLIKSL